MAPKLEDRDKETMAQAIIDVYNESLTLLDYVDSLTEEELNSSMGLKAFIAVPIVGLTKVFVHYTNLINKMQNLGGKPTADESKLVLVLGDVIARAFNDIERTIASAEEEPEDTKDTTIIPPSGNLH